MLNNFGAVLDATPLVSSQPHTSAPAIFSPQAERGEEGVQTTAQIKILIVAKMYRLWFYNAIVDASEYACFIAHQHKIKCWTDGCICSRTIILIMYE